VSTTKVAALLKPKEPGTRKGNTVPSYLSNVQVSFDRQNAQTEKRKCVCHQQRIEARMKQKKRFDE
jgi:hypothetical protein